MYVCMYVKKFIFALTFNMLYGNQEITEDIIEKV